MPVRKRFGQHFLHDRGVIRRIIDAISPADGDRVVEIGPGRGALTWDLLQRAHGLDVIEIDRDLAQSLKASARGRSGIARRDALHTDFMGCARGRRCAIVGNLPYNISTPLLFRLWRGGCDCRHALHAAKEVDRMTAEPRTKPMAIDRHARRGRRS